MGGKKGKGKKKGKKGKTQRKPSDPGLAAGEGQPSSSSPSAPQRWDALFMRVARHGDSPWAPEEAADVLRGAVALWEEADTAGGMVREALHMRDAEKRWGAVVATVADVCLQGEGEEDLGSLVLDDRLRGAVPTECGDDDILRVPMEVAVESASLHPVLCWMYGRGVSLPKVRRLLLGASDHLLLRGACALAQKWGLKGFVQALENAAFDVGGVQACEALGTTRPLVRAAVESWLPSGDTVRALGLSRRCREWAGPGASSCR